MCITSYLYWLYGGFLPIRKEPAIIPIHYVRLRPAKKVLVSDIVGRSGYMANILGMNKLQQLKRLLHQYGSRSRPRDPVLHRWCFYAFEGEKADMSWLAAMVVALAVPPESVPHFPLIQRRLLPHSDRILPLLRTWAHESSSDVADLPSRSNACHQLGNLYSAQGKMKETEEMYLRALAGYENAWCREHKQPLDTRYYLASMYKEVSMLEEAAKHFRLVVEGYTKVLGARDSETIEAFNQLEELRQFKKRM